MKLFELRTGKPRAPRLLLLASALMAVFTHIQIADAVTQKHNVAFVHLKGIKPYQSLTDLIAKNLTGKPKTKVFEIDIQNDGENRKVKDRLKSFGPDVIVCIGRKAYEFCAPFALAPIISAYDAGLFGALDPFSMIWYLKPNAKNIAVVKGGKLTESKVDELLSKAGQFGLDLTIRNTNPVSWQSLMAGSEAVIANGVVLIKVRDEKQISGTGPVVAIVDKRIASYRLLEEACKTQFPKIDKIITFDGDGGDSLHDKISALRPRLIICIGINSYPYCGYSGADVVVAFSSQDWDDNISQWGYTDGVSMYIDPKGQLEILDSVVQSPITLAIPYDPQNTELFIAKAVMWSQSETKLVPVVIADPIDAGRIITKAFDNYDGLWIIPDSTLSLGPLQKLLLQESLRRQKILITMMHPYTQRGAMMSITGIEEDKTALCSRLTELIDQRLKHPQAPGRIVLPRPSVALNIRTIKKLGYNTPEKLLQTAEKIYGNN